MKVNITFSIDSEVAAKFRRMMDHGKRSKVIEDMLADLVAQKVSACPETIELEKKLESMTASMHEAERAAVFNTKLQPYLKHIRERDQPPIEGAANISWRADPQRREKFIKDSSETLGISRDELERLIKAVKK